VDVGVYSGWDSFLLKFDGEDLFDRRSIFYIINNCLLKMRWHSLRRSL